MPRWLKIFLIASALTVVGVVVAIILVAPSIQRSLFYPKPQGLPPVVNETTEQLLARLQAVLETNAPVVAQSLQPGLSDARIAELERRGRFRLSDDLRAFYRWHDGTPTNSTIGLLPGHRFIPLAEVVNERALMQQESGMVFWIIAGYRKGW